MKTSKNKFPLEETETQKAIDYKEGKITVCPVCNFKKGDKIKNFLELLCPLCSLKKNSVKFVSVNLVDLTKKEK